MVCDSERQWRQLVHWPKHYQ